jgi:alanyl-tRNA synthetase/misacylated tRNA(Ala) deacylase
VHATSPASAAPLAQKGREKKKNKSAAATPSETPGGSGTATPVGKLWEVELEDTVVFPEGELGYQLSRLSLLSDMRVVY